MVSFLFSGSNFAKDKKRHPCRAEHGKYCSHCRKIKGDRSERKKCAKLCMLKNEENLSSKCKAHRAKRKASYSFK